MKRNSVFTKIAALMLCVMMVIGCLPMSAFAWEGEIDVQPVNAALSVAGDGEATGDNELVLYSGLGTTIYSWTAIGEGTLSIVMPNYVGWDYKLTVNGTKVAESNTSAEYPDAYPVADVKAGDAVVLTVDTANYGTSASVKANIAASFQYAEGTANNPAVIDIPWGGTYTIGAGETMYFSVEYFMGQWQGFMTVSSDAAFSAVVNGRMPVMNGVATQIEYNAQFGRMVALNITNTSAADADYTISFAVPVGTADNPAELNVGTVDAKGANSATSDYVYAYSVTEAGTITIEMTSDTWFYNIEKIDGLTSVPSQTGETWSDDEGASATVSYDVVAGDIVKVMVMPYSAAEVTFDAWFVPAATEEPEPEEPEATVAMIGDQGFATVADALNAAGKNDVVVMVADSNEADSILIIKPGVTLYLATYDLTAGYLIGLNGSFIYGDRFIDANNDLVADADHAVLKVEQDNVSLSSGSVWYIEAENRKYIPVWYNGQYVFTQSRFNNVSYTKTADDGGYTTIKFWAQFADLRKNILLGGDGITDNDLSVIAVIKYTTSDGVEVTSEYFYTTDLINNFVLQNYALTCGMGNCDSYSNLEFQLRIVSGSGVAIETDIVKYESL